MNTQDIELKFSSDLKKFCEKYKLDKSRFDIFIDPSENSITMTSMIPRWITFFSTLLEFGYFKTSNQTVSNEAIDEFNSLFSEYFSNCFEIISQLDDEKLTAHTNNILTIIQSNSKFNIIELKLPDRLKQHLVAFKLRE